VSKRKKNKEKERNNNAATLIRIPNDGEDDFWANLEDQARPE
jgi:hypothetical protein